MFVQPKEGATVQTVVPRADTVHVDAHKQITPNHKIFTADTSKFVVALGGSNVVGVDNNNTGPTCSNLRSNNKNRQVSNLLY